MSRFSGYDDFEGGPEQILAMGRWEHNARVALKGRRGRKALAELREALMALPEHRLIGDAMCTAGAPGRLPPVTDAEMAAHAAKLRAQGADEDIAHRCAEGLREAREDERRELAMVAERQGPGVCAVGAYIWYREVKAGADPQEALTRLPLIFDGQADGDGMTDTAEAGKAAGLTFTLACELAYKNDETFGSKTPEGRWQAFVDWIDAELASAA